MTVSWLSSDTNFRTSFAGTPGVQAVAKDTGPVDAESARFPAQDPIFKDAQDDRPGSAMQGEAGSSMASNSCACRAISMALSRRKSAEFFAQEKPDSISCFRDNTIQESTIGSGLTEFAYNVFRFGLGHVSLDRGSPETQFGTEGHEELDAHPLRISPDDLGLYADSSSADVLERSGPLQDQRINSADVPRLTSKQVGAAATDVGYAQSAGVTGR